MFDAFPHEKWDDTITTFWTFGNEGDTGTTILTILGVLLMLFCLVWFVRLEAGKLDRQAAGLRQAMGPGPSGP
jgi:LPXTG-motif cell wall-anchored protein